MEFHPSQVPIERVFDIKEEKEASDIAQEIVKLGFSNKKMGFKVLMPKEEKIAKRIGFIITTGINYGLRQSKQVRDIRYWTYQHDKDHFAIVLIGSKVFEELGF